MDIITGTGEILSFFDIARPMGATMSTVATLSTKALITPAKRAKTVTAHFTFGTFEISGQVAVYKQGNDAHGTAYHKQNIIVNAQKGIDRGEIVQSAQPENYKYRSAAQGYIWAVFLKGKHKHIEHDKNY